MTNELSLQISAESGSLAAIRDFVAEKAQDLGSDPLAIPELLLALTEAATNIIVHGYRGQSGTIEVVVGRSGSDLQVTLRDQTPPFDPTTVPAPDLSLPLAKRPFGGVGIHMIRQLVDEIRYQPRSGGGNELILIKKQVF